MQKPIRTREELLVYIAGHISFKHIARAMHEGVVENLGAFSIKGSEGWIVRVQTLIGKQNQYIGVSVSDKRYRMLLTDLGPEHGGWKYWVGDNSENPLYRGDNPDEYIKLREKEIENGKTKKH